MLPKLCYFFRDFLDKEKTRYISTKGQTQLRADAIPLIIAVVVLPTQLHHVRSDHALERRHILA